MGGRPAFLGCLEIRSKIPINSELFGFDYFHRSQPEDMGSGGFSARFMPRRNVSFKCLKLLDFIYPEGFRKVVFVTIFVMIS